MSYTKAILYGEYLETYYYERNPVISERKGDRRKSGDGNSSVVNDGVDSQQSVDKKARRSDSARRSELAFRRLLLCNLEYPTCPVLVTLTYAENVQDMRRARKDFVNFQKRCSRIFGRNFRYVVVPEFQKRGAIHFHALIWGIPTSVVRQERESRMVANIWGQGFVDLVITDGDAKLAFYLSKYLAKAHEDSRLYGVCAYTCSRNIERPQVVTHAQEWALLETLELSTVDLLRERHFETRMLGKGRFRLYKKQKHANNSIQQADV